MTIDTFHDSFYAQLESTIHNRTCFTGSCGEGLARECPKGEAKRMPIAGAAEQQPGYVDCQTGSQSTLYVHRPRAAHSPIEPGRDSPHAHRHLSQYQYPGNLCRVDLHRAQSRRH